jgi:hypothetical protein
MRFPKPGLLNGHPKGWPFCLSQRGFALETTVAALAPLPFGAINVFDPWRRGRDPLRGIYRFNRWFGERNATVVFTRYTSRQPGSTTATDWRGVAAGRRSGWNPSWRHRRPRDCTPPNQFVGIEFRCVSGQVLGHDFRMLGQGGLNNFRLPMNLAVIPQHRQRPAYLLFELPQEIDNVVAVHIVGQQIKVQVQAPDFGADGDTIDSRDAIPSVPAIQCRFAAAGRRGTPHGRGQHVPRFIEKNQVRIALPHFLGKCGKMHLLPIRDCRLIPFACLVAWLLGRPVQTGTEETTDVIVMKRFAEMPTNQFGHAGTGPQLGAPAMSLSALQKKRQQALVLFGGQAWRRTRMRFGDQAVGLLSTIKPAVHRRAIDAKDTGYCFGTLLEFHRLHGLPAPPLQFRGCSKWSTHKELE